MRPVLRRLAAVARRRRLDEELAEELRLHLELRRQALIDEGMDPAHAEREARRRFGNPLRVREDARDAVGFRLIDELRQDARFGARLLRRSPIFALAVIGPLAVGIGATTSVFAVVDAVLLRELNVREPQRLAELDANAPTVHKHLGNTLPYGVFEQARRAVDFADLIAFRGVNGADLSADGTESQSIAAELVSDDYFATLGVGAAAGQLLDAQASPSSLVLSERAWRSRFDADPRIAGRIVSVNGIRFTIAGVAAGFRGLVADRAADAFFPLAAASLIVPGESRSTPGNVNVVLRLHGAHTREVAAERLAALLTALGPLGPQKIPIDVALPSAARGLSELRSEMRAPLLALFGLVLALLTIACANLGNLVLSRVAARQDEFALRIAIGAGRGRLLQQVTVEAVIMSVVAGMASLSLAAPGARLLLRMAPASIGASHLDPRIDQNAVLLTMGLAIMASIVVASCSGLRLRRLPATDTLGSLLRPARQRSVLAQALIAVQVACSMLLLVGSGSMLQTVQNLWNVDPGFRTDGAFFLSVTAPSTVTDRHRYFAALGDALGASPHISHVSLLQFPLMGRAQTTGTVDVPGFVPTSDDDRWVRVFQVGPRFFETMGMPLVRGRGIDARDTADAPDVAVVNESFARFYYGSLDVVGRGGRPQIVGVVRDARYDGPREDSPRAMFVPYQQVRARPAMTYVVRAVLNRSAALSAARAAVRQAGAGAQVSTTSLDDQAQSTVWRELFLARLSAALALMATMLACGGVYAVVSCAVVERRREIGIRMALGARRRDIVPLVVAQPLLTALAGLAVGLPVAAFMMRGIRSLLFGIASFDPTTILAGAASIIAITFVAALVPAWRACAADPRQAFLAG